MNTQQIIEYHQHNWRHATDFEKGQVFELYRPHFMTTFNKYPVFVEKSDYSLATAIFTSSGRPKLAFKTYDALTDRNIYSHYDHLGLVSITKGDIIVEIIERDKILYPNENIKITVMRVEDLKIVGIDNIIGRFKILYSINHLKPDTMLDIPFFVKDKYKVAIRMTARSFRHKTSCELQPQVNKSKHRTYHYVFVHRDSNGELITHIYGKRYKIFSSYEGFYRVYIEYDKNHNETGEVCGYRVTPEFDKPQHNEIFYVAPSDFKIKFNEPGFVKFKKDSKFYITTKYNKRTYVIIRHLDDIYKFISIDHLTDQIESSGVLHESEYTNAGGTYNLLTNKL